MTEITGEKATEMYASKEGSELDDPTALCIPDQETHSYRLAKAAETLVDRGVKTVLDIGAGFGLLKDVLGDGVEYTGVEEQQWMAVKAKDAGRYVHCDKGQDFLDRTEPNSVDAVVLLGVVATLTDEEVFDILVEAKRVCSKGILLSYQIRGEYEGAFRSYDLNDFKFLGHAACQLSTFSDTECTIWIPKA